MYDINHLPGIIELGYVGEKGFRTIEFDLRPWLQLLPDGVASIVHIRPGETASEAYIAATTLEEGILSWTISDGDLGTLEGYGTAQIWLEEADGSAVGRRGKSAKVQTYIREAVDEASEEVPPAQESWMEQMTALKVATVEAKDKALVAVNRYPYIDAETFHWMVWDVTTQDYVDTGVDGRGTPGPAGPQGEKGDRGADGIAIMQGAYTYSLAVNADGDLIMTYVDNTVPPDLSINSDGDLIMIIA